MCDFVRQVILFLPFLIFHFDILEHFRCLFQIDTGYRYSIGYDSKGRFIILSYVAVDIFSYLKILKETKI
jgi:hypothetical protein